MPDRLRETPEYKFINPSEYAEILRTEPLWYLNPKISGLFDEYFSKDTDKEESNWLEIKWEVIRMFGQALAKEELYLDKTKPEFWNDDDRPHPKIREMFKLPELKEGEGVHTAVVHHSATKADLTYDELNALHMIRLYIPLFRMEKGGFKGKDGEFIPVSSGHKYNGRETFVGYHYIVRNDGSWEKILKDEYVGFHAGKYSVNCNSFGICIIDDLTNKRPTEEALDTTHVLVDMLAPKNVIGHREVILDEKTGKTVDTNCPGDMFLGEDGWKKELTS